jgi:outer membrane protein assembly factor BamE
MTKGQVESILGSPVYTTTFNANRMDYVYTYQRQGKRLHEQKVIISFRGGVVSHVEADLNTMPKKRSWF